MTAAPLELTRGRAWALTLVATFTMAVSYFDRQTLSVLAPVVTKELNISDAEYGWLASAFSIAYLVGAPLAGWMIDRVGARRGLFWAVAIWSVVAALHAVVPGFGVLFALRIALGLAESPSFPGAAQTIVRSLPKAEQPRAFGVLFTGSSFGAMVIPPVATYLLAVYGWRASFLGTAVIGLIWIPLWIAVAYRPDARAALDHAEPEHGSGPGLLEVLFHPAVTRGVILVLACAPALSFMFLWLSKYLVFQYSMKPTDVGAYLWMPPLFLDAGSLLFGDLAARRRRTRGVEASDGLLVTLAALLTMSVVLLPLAKDPISAMIVCGLTMAGGGGLFALNTGDMLARVPARIVSRAGGMTAAAQSLAYIVASPLIGASVEDHHGYAEVLVELGLWIIPGTIVWVAWGRRFSGAR